MHTMQLQWGNCIINNLLLIIWLIFSPRVDTKLCNSCLYYRHTNRRDPCYLHVCSIGVPKVRERGMESCTFKKWRCIEGATMTARVVYSIQTKLSKSRIILTTNGDRHHRFLEKHWCSRYTTSLLNLLLCIPNDQALISFVRRGSNRAICHG